MRLCHFPLCHHALASLSARCHLLACMPVDAYIAVRYNIDLYTSCYQLFLLLLHYTSLLASLLRRWTLPLYLFTAMLVCLPVCTLPCFFLWTCVLHSHTGIQKKSGPLQFQLSGPWNTTSKFHTFYWTKSNVNLRYALSHFKLRRYDPLN